MTSTELVDNQRYRVVESVQRVMMIFRLLLDVDNDYGLSVTHAARALGVDKSTVSRLLGTLAAAGMVVADEETRRYRIGPLAFQLGNRFEGAVLARTLQPTLRQLADRTNATTQVGTMRGQRVLYLLVAQAGSRLRVVASPGDTRLLHASAMGKALLAAMPDAERDAMISALATGPKKILPGSGPNTITDSAALTADLVRSRKRGYVVSNEEAESGISAVGVAVPSPPHFPLALSAAFPTAQYRKAEDRAPVIKELRDAAKTIGRIFESGV